MEGRASNFRRVLADFESRLHGAEFIAIDTELTGVDLAGEPDTFEESAHMRLDKNCRIAERYTLIQLGLTVASRIGEASDGPLSFASYNIFAFPYMGPELLGHEPGFFCQASALQFNAQHRVDFNKWISEGVPYMSREDERRYLKASQENGSAEKRTGILLLWKALCAARLPLVVHCPLDLFFLLAAFERKPLPRNDPRAMAMMIRQCTPKVYDTAHLHGALGQFKRLGLVKFFEDAKARYDELRENGNGMDSVPRVEFKLLGETSVRYNKRHDELAHEAGFDSLLTAQLFAYLRAIAPARVREGANRLFLYRSVEYLDLDRAVQSGHIGTSMFDLTRVTLLVAAVDPMEGNEAARLISVAGSQFKWMDATHILVVLRASGGAAVRKAAELAAKVHGVVSWMGFDEWRAAQASCTGSSVRAQEYTNGCKHLDGLDEEQDDDFAEGASSASSPRSGFSANGCSESPARCMHNSVDGKESEWSLAAIVAAGAASAVCSALLAVLLMRGRALLAVAGTRLLRRWRRR